MSEVWGVSGHLFCRSHRQPINEKLWGRESKEKSKKRIQFHHEICPEQPHFFYKTLSGVFVADSTGSAMIGPFAVRCISTGTYPVSEWCFTTAFLHKSTSSTTFCSAFIHGLLWILVSVSHPFFFFLFIKYVF